MTDEPRTWYARICCPVCYGPMRVRLQEKEGRCRGCRPQREHSIPRRQEQSNFARFVARHQRASQ